MLSLSAAALSFNAPAVPLRRGSTITMSVEGLTDTAKAVRHASLRGLGHTSRLARSGFTLSRPRQLNPVIGFWDPLNLSGGEFWGDSNTATIGFLRESEIKHGRVAMAGFVGYIVHANDIRFPWDKVANSVPTGLSPQALWDATPEAAKWQASAGELILAARGREPQERPPPAPADPCRCRARPRS